MCKKIDGFPKYYINKTGSVISMYRGKILKPSITHGGYYRVVLVNNDGKKSKHVHRVLLESFTKRPSNLHFTNHKNGNKKDNRLENLEWMTVRENIIHSRRILGRCIGSKHGRSKLNENIVKMIKQSNISSRKLSKQLSIPRSTIQHIRRGRTWKHV